MKKTLSVAGRPDDADKRALLHAFVAEDTAAGDPTGEMVSDAPVTGRLVARQAGVVSGTLHAKAIFEIRGCSCVIGVQDGGAIRAGDTLMTVSGMASDILSLERTALNLVSRMSGIATMAASLAALLPDGVRLLSTRKTAPGLRAFDKEAVECGGGLRHRMNLGEMVLIKDNHVAVEGSLERLVLRARERGGRFEVEVDAPQDAVLAARLGAPVIMLDNFTPDEIRRTVEELDGRGLRRGVELEASGGITLQNIAEYGRSGVDYVSVGSMTNSAPALDLGLDI